MVSQMKWPKRQADLQGSAEYLVTFGNVDIYKQPFGYVLQYGIGYHDFIIVVFSNRDPFGGLTRKVTSSKYRDAIRAFIAFDRSSS